jgi:hypothetical protein
MIRLTLRTPLIVDVAGLDPRIPPAAWSRALTHVGLLFQHRVRLAYARSRTGLGAPFLPNDPRYDARKVAQGLDPRPGHRELRIQTTMRSELLFGITSVTPAGTAVVTMLEELLRLRQPHAYHYERRKVPRRWLLQLNPAWLEEVRWPLDTLMARAETIRRDGPQRQRTEATAAAERNLARSRGIVIAAGPGKARRFTLPATPEKAEVARRIIAQRDAAMNVTRSVAVAEQQWVAAVVGGPGAQRMATSTAPSVNAPEAPRRVYTLAQTAWDAAIATANRLRRL